MGVRPAPSQPRRELNKVQVASTEGDDWTPIVSGRGEEATRVPNVMCLTSYALALVLVACVKVRKAK